MDNDTPPYNKSDQIKPPLELQEGALTNYISSDASPEKDKRNEGLIHEMIEIHRKELEDVGTQLAKEARKRTRLTSVVKAVVIFLGAFVAVKEVANQLVGSSNTVNIIIFTIAGLLIATLTGLEAAFKWENTAAELKSLAATSRAASRNTASNLAKAYATKQEIERLEELKKVLDILDNVIVDVQKRSAAIGIETVMVNSVFGSQVLVASERSNIRGSRGQIEADGILRKNLHIHGRPKRW